MRRSLASAVTGILALSATAVVAVATASPATAAAGGSYNGLALTPPMGFNDWNAYHCNVSADLIEQTALAMHNNGMQAAGYDYVDIDDCWILGRDASEIPPGQTKASVGRGADGHLIVDPNYFPSSAPGLNDGIKLVADYVHSLGMKLGIYEDTGTATCQGLAGTYKGPNGATWDAIDAQDFADWGVDFLKDDWCNVPLADVPGATRDDKANYLYTQMSQALAATGKPIVFEAATLGDSNLHTYTWAPAVSNFWRTTSDISASFSSMLRNFTTNSTLAQYAGPGHWNDPDMLEIGTGSTTTLAAPVTPGDTIVKVASTSGALVGAPIRFGTTASGDLEGGIISAVGTAGATGTGLTLTAPLVLAHPSGVAPAVAVLKNSGGGPQVRAGLKDVRQAEAEPGQVPAVDLGQAEVDVAPGFDERRGLRHRVIYGGGLHHHARGAVDGDGQRLEAAFDLNHRKERLWRNGRRALGGEGKGGG